MGLRGLVWIGSFSIVFLFIPSLALKLWESLIYASWEVKQWLIYLIIALILVFIVRKKWRHRISVKTGLNKGESLLFIAKERLVKGELSLEEFREIKRELEQAEV